VTPHSSAATDRERLVACAGIVGGAGVAAGSAMPWLTVFHGLRSYSGLAGLNGRLLAVGGGAAAVLAVGYAVRRGSRLRLSIGLAGAALGIFIAYLAAQLLDVYRSLHGLYLPGLGPGLIVAGTGALLMISSLFVRIDSAALDQRHAAMDAPTTMLIALSSGAGTIHLAVAAEHFIEFTLYGVFFVALGLAQVLWALLVAIRGTTRTLLVAALGNILMVVLYAVSRTTGLPISPEPWVPETVGFAGVAATAFELLLAGMAASLLLRRRPRTWSARVASVFPLAIAATTIAALLIDVGAASHG
jgi:hypothetical protein